MGEVGEKEEEWKMDELARAGFCGHHYARDDQVARVLPSGWLPGSSSRVGRKARSARKGARNYCCPQDLSQIHIEGEDDGME
jgi:hypothetical protein